VAAGPATAWSLGVNWTGSLEVAEQSYLLGEVTITRGRSSEADDIQPGVLAGTLDNTTGRFTPDNPLSALHPSDGDGARTRFFVWRGGTFYPRHQGRLVVGEPTLENGDTARAVMPFQSVGILGEMAGRTLRCDFVERWRQVAETNNVDLYALEGTTLENIGTGGGTARIVPSKTGAGTWDVQAPDGVMLDWSITLTPAVTQSPTLQFRCGSSYTATNMIVFSFRTAQRIVAGGSARTVARGLDSSGGQVWSLRLVDNAGQTDLNLYDASAALVSTVYSGFAAVGDDSGDDQWFTFSLENNGTQSAYLRRCVDGVLVSGGVTGGITSQDTRTLILGAAAAASFGGVAMSDYVTDSQSLYTVLSPRTSAGTRYADLNLYADYASSTSGSRFTEISRKALGGRSAFDVLAEVARTSGSLVTESRSSYSLAFFLADTLRLPAVALTVDVQADLGAEWPWRKGDVPSSVTVTYPAGQVTVTDATRVRVDESIDTCAADALGARNVASSRVNSSRRLRLTRLVVDLAGASNDLWASMMALEVGDRIRVTLGAADSLLVAQYGYTYVDVYAAGWVEHYGQDVAYWEIDTIPADDPVEGEFDSDLRGRFCADAGAMTVTGGTAVGTTGTGTIVVTTSTGPAVTVDSTAYPVTFDWQGEYVTVTSPPASATSPQTLTITARGVAPTVARIHASGETFNSAYQPAYTF
jgi:hypothetical protein